MAKITNASEQKKTRYRNDRSFQQEFVVWENSEWIRYVFAPGEVQEVPSIHDFAIHMLNPSGTQIEGGLAPQLTNVDRPELLLAEHLDTEAQKKKDAAAALVAAQQDKAKAEQAALLAAARLAQAEADKAKATATVPPPAPAEEKKR